jgi:hypothetical protein
MTLLYWVVAVGTVVIVGWAIAARLVRRIPAIDFSDERVLLREWYESAAAFTPQHELHAHIIKHASELIAEIEGDGSYETWSASMHNLLAIYDAKHGVEPDTTLKLERMTAKFLSQPTDTAAPPRPVPARIVAAARGPSIEARRREAARVARAREESRWSY